MKLKLLFLFLVFFILGCNSNDSSEKGNTVDNESIANNEKFSAKLYFEQEFGNLENQKSSYQLLIDGNNIKINYTYSDYPTVEADRAKFKDGKIISNDGCGECYILENDELCVQNPETGEFDCYYYISSKSSHSVEDVLNSINTSLKKSNIILSLDEIRIKVISGDKYNLFKRLGKPDEALMSYEFLEKYFNRKTQSVHETNILIDGVTFIYNNISDKPIVVLYDARKAEVREVMYRDEINNINDVAVGRVRWEDFMR